MKIRFILLLFLALCFTGNAYAEYQVIDKNQSGTIGSPTKPFRKAYLGSLTPLVFEGAVTNDYQTTVVVAEPTADRTITFPDNSGTVQLTGAVDAANAVWFIDNGIKFEGVTDDAYESIFQPLSAPIADKTISFPNLNDATVWISLLVTNDVDVANSIWGASNAIVFEGSSADAYETSIVATNPTADNTATLPDASGTFLFKTGVASGSTFTTITETTTATAADAGTVYACATDAIVLNLPTAASCPGCVFTYINTGVAGNNILELNPNNADKIFGTFKLAASIVTINGDSGEAIKNTKNTSTKGNMVSVISDGTYSWYIIAGSGIWAEETP